MTASAQSVGAFWRNLPGGFRRWAIGTVGANGVAAVVITQNGNEVKDYLSQHGFQNVANVEVSTQIRQINVDLDSTKVTYAMSVCGALRGRFTDGHGADLSVVVYSIHRTGPRVDQPVSPVASKTEAAEQLGYQDNHRSCRSSHNRWRRLEGEGRGT